MTCRSNGPPANRTTPPARQHKLPALQPDGYRRRSRPHVDRSARKNYLFYQDAALPAVEPYENTGIRVKVAILGGPVSHESLHLLAVSDTLNVGIGTPVSGGGVRDPRSSTWGLFFGNADTLRGVQSFGIGDAREAFLATQHKGVEQ